MDRELTTGEQLAGIAPEDLVDTETEDEAEPAAADAAAPDQETAPEGAEETPPEETEPEAADEERTAGERETEEGEEVATEPAPPEPAPEPTMVPVGALQEERRRRQAAEAALTRLRPADGGVANAPEPPQDPLDVIPDDDLVTGAQVKNILRERDQRAAAAQFHARNQDGETRAIAELTEQAAGKGLDYKSVMQHPGAEAVVHMHVEAICRSQDPARAAYTLVRDNVPELRQLADDRRFELKMAEHEEKKKKKPPATLTRPVVRRPSDAAEEDEDEVEDFSKTVGGRIVAHIMGDHREG